MKYSMMMNEFDYSHNTRGTRLQDVVAEDMTKEAFDNQLMIAEGFFNSHLEEGSLKVDYGTSILFEIKMSDVCIRYYTFKIEEEVGIKLGIDNSFALINFYQFSDGSNVAVFQDLTKECEYLVAENVSNTAERFAPSYQTFSARWKAEEWMEEVKKAKVSK